MKIEIKADNDDGKIKVVFTNEALNNNNFVDMLIYKTNEDEDVLIEEVTLPLNETLTALIAFDMLKNKYDNSADRT